MNNGAFGENFPYSNFHGLNMDWIIKIAKDFLDQYTHIQETITSGEESLENLTTSGLAQLQEKADALEALLQAWYEEHSQDIADQLADALADLTEWYTEHSGDIADQLADALADLTEWYTEHIGFLDQYVSDSISEFNTFANQKTAESIASIPEDYTSLSKSVEDIQNALNTEGFTFFNDKTAFTYPGYLNANGNYQADVGFLTTDYIPISDIKSIIMTATTMANLSNIVLYDANNTIVSKYTGSGIAELNTFELQIPAEVSKVRFSITNTDYVQIVYTSVTEEEKNIYHNIELIKDALNMNGYTIIADKNLFILPGYLNANGNYQTAPGYLTTDYYTLPKCTEITMKASALANLSNIVIYDDNNNVIGKYTGSGSAHEETITLDIPANAVKARFCIVETDTVNIIIHNEIIPKATVWLAIGDSITLGYGNDDVSYADYASDTLGITLNKQGVSGSTLGAILNRIDAGDFDNTNPTIITLLAGTNDWNIDRRAMNYEYDTIYNADTYMGYLNTIIEKLQFKFPTAQLVILSCLQRNYIGDDPDIIRGITNGNNETLEDYRDALILSCVHHGVPYIDLYAESGICASNYLPAETNITPSIARLTIDGLHPNDLGHKFIARIVAGKMIEYIK
ncbi:MAG: hypothetical protein J6Q34_02615 [Bacteroidales bacterium]|nr:hypothetical protein [Bacteroidales bacterium]